MLEDQYLVALLDIDNPTDLAKVKRVLELTRNKFIDSKEIEGDLKEIFNIDSEKVIRSLLYKMEEAAIIKVNKKKVNGGYYVNWFYTYIDEERRNASLMKDAIDVELEKVEKVKERFSEHQFMFFCENTCSPKLYSYDQMYELEGKCAMCGEGRLLMLSDEAKSQSLKSFAFRLKPFIDKRAVIIDLFQTIFPNNTRLLEVAMKELYDYTVNIKKEIEIEMPPPITLKDGISLLSLVTDPSFDESMFADPVIPVPIQNEAIPELSVADVMRMTDEELMVECMHRWIIATKYVYENLLDLSSQRKSRLRSFTMKKFFFCDTMGKKYISRALVGIDDKQIAAKMRGTFSLFQSNGYFKIQSYHPKFVTKGVSRFIEMCNAGEVYQYEEYKEDIKDSLIAFLEVNKGARITPIDESPVDVQVGNEKYPDNESDAGGESLIMIDHRSVTARSSFAIEGMNPPAMSAAGENQLDKFSSDLKTLDF